MNIKAATSLWIDTTRSQYFLIPDNQEIPSGDFEISAINGSKKKVSLTAIASFEIIESEAKDHLQIETLRGLEKFKKSFLHLIIYSNQDTQSPKETKTVQNFLAAILGISPQELANNPEAARGNFLNLYSDLEKLLDTSTEIDLDRAKNNYEIWLSLQERIKAQGIDIEQLEQELAADLPDTLERLFSSGNVEQLLPQITSKLRELANYLDGSSELTGQKIDQIIADFNQDLFPEKEKKLEKKRKQKYKKSARDAIAQSFSSLNLPSFAGGSLKSQNSQSEEQ